MRISIYSTVTEQVAYYRINMFCENYCYCDEGDEVRDNNGEWGRGQIGLRSIKNVQINIDVHACILLES